MGEEASRLEGISERRRVGHYRRLVLERYWDCRMPSLKYSNNSIYATPDQFYNRGSN
jgi:hypothetical protein